MNPALVFLLLAQSAPATEAMTEIVLPEAPYKLKAAATETGVSLSWSAPSGPPPAGYHVYRGESAGGPYAQINESLLVGTLTFLDAPTGQPLLRGKTYHYVVSSENAEGLIGLNSDELAIVFEPGTQSPPADAAPAPPQVRGRVRVQADDKSVKLSWTLEGEPVSVKNFVVYRSEAPDKPLAELARPDAKARSFEDVEAVTRLKPNQSQSYAYKVAVVVRTPEPEEAAPVSAAAAPVSGAAPPQPSPSATPAPRAPPLEIALSETLSVKVQGPPPAFVIPTKFNLPFESSLKIRGEKIVGGSYDTKTYWKREDNPATREDERRENLFKPEQELRVQVEGTISERVKVNVDFDDSPFLPQPKQEISIRYEGGKEDSLQEVAFGDIQLDAAGTEFLTYNPGKQLFGLKAKVKIRDQVSVSALFAQTKGIPEQKVFKGASSPSTLVIKDVAWSRGRYVYLTRKASDLPLKNDERVWLDDGIGTNNLSGNVYTVQGVSRDSSGNAVTAPVYLERLSPGQDYIVDRQLGLLKFLRPIDVYKARIAVGYRNSAGVTVGLYDESKLASPNGPVSLFLNGQGQTSDNEPMIFDYFQLQNGEVSPSAHYAQNIYDLNTQSVLDPELDPDFEVVVRAKGGAEIRRTTRDNDLFELDTEEGFLRFKDPTVLLGSAAMAQYNSLVCSGLASACDRFPFFDPAGSALADKLRVYKINAGIQESFNEIVVRYKFRNPSFRLDRFNILQNSESVYVDGKRLKRNEDYTFDYFSGNITFTHPQDIGANSEIQVNYEYLPFLGRFQTNLFASRLEYFPSPTFRLGSAYLLNFDQKPPDIPQAGSAPSRLDIADANADISITGDSVAKFARELTGLKKLKLPLDARIVAEAAQSRFNPNTFQWDTSTDTMGEKAEREKGVALIDSMEGVGEVISFPSISTGYFPSSAPSGTFPLNFYADQGASNRKKVTFASQQSSKGGHIYENLANPKAEDQVDVLKFDYSGMTSSRWDGYRCVLSRDGLDLTRTRFLEIWLKPDASATIRLNVEIGDFSEDSNDNGCLDDEDKPGADSNGDGCMDSRDYPPPDGQLSVAENVGIPMYYEGNITTPWNDPDRRDLEDTDDDGALDTADRYYRYSFDVLPGTKWQLVRVPVGPTEWQKASAVYGNVAYDRLSGGPDSTRIRQGRFWIRGVDGNPQSGTLSLESIQFTGNVWELKTDPSVSVPTDTQKFDVAAVSKDLDSAYPPDMNFVDLRNTDSTDEARLKRREQALKVTYSLSSDETLPVTLDSGQITAAPLYFASRTISDIDLGSYEEIRLDLYRKLVDSGNRGERLVLRFEVDPLNYYQFALPLDAVPQGVWRVLTLPLSRNDGTLVVRGVPLLDSIKRISLGILSDAGPPRPFPAESLYINNIRFEGGQIRKGSALRSETTVSLAKGWLAATHRYREEDSGFQRLDQSNRNNQHLRRNSVDIQASSLKLFGSPVRNLVTLAQEERTNEPEYASYRYFFGLPEKRTQAQGARLDYSRALPGGAGQLDLHWDAQRARTETTYDSAYLRSQSSLGFFDVIGETRLMNPSLVYKLPSKILGVGMGQTSVSLKAGYQSEKAVYPQHPDVAFQRDTRDREIRFDTRSTPIKKASLNASATYGFRDVRGNTENSASEISKLQGQPGLQRWYPYQESLDTQAGLRYDGVPGLAPNSSYKTSYKRAFYKSQASTENSLTYGTDIKPDVWWKALKPMEPGLSVSREIRSTAQYESFQLGYSEDLLGKNPAPDGGRPISGLGLLGLRPLDERAIRDTFRVYDQASGRFTFFKALKPTINVSQDKVSTVYRGGVPGRTQKDSARLSLAYLPPSEKPLVKLGPFLIRSATLDGNASLFREWEASTEALLVRRDESEAYDLSLPYRLWKDVDGQFTQGGTKSRGLVRREETLGTEVRGGYTGTWRLARTLKFNPLAFLPFIKGHNFSFKQNTNLRWGATYQRNIRYSPQNPRLGQDATTTRANFGLEYQFLDNLKFKFEYTFTKYLDKKSEFMSYYDHLILIRGTLVF